MTSSEAQPRSHPEIKAHAATTADAWYHDLCSRTYSHAVTLTWNKHYKGSTTSPSYRISADDGVCTVHRSGSRANKIFEAARVDPYVSTSTIDTFYREVDRKLFGKRFYEFTDDRRSNFIGFAENIDTNYHIHFAWSVPKFVQHKFYKTVQSIWRKNEPNSSIKIRPIYSTGWYSYVTDSIRYSPMPDDVPVYISSREKK